METDNLLLLRFKLLSFSSASQNIGDHAVAHASIDFRYEVRGDTTIFKRGQGAQVRGVNFFCRCGIVVMTGHDNVPS
jgi:hypothetical protein